MIAILTLIALLSAYLIADRMSSTSTELLAEREKLTQKALRDAKAALLGYVAKYASDTGHSVPGRFPCYEDASIVGTPNEGNEAAGGTCNTNTIIQFGRLPWNTISLGDVRDGWGEKLWYALSPGFRDSPINSTTAGQILLDGKPVVALIIAPGPSISSQSRPALPGSMAYNYFGSASVYSNYLEGENASSPVDVNFTSAGLPGSFNDRVIAITQREVFDIVEPIVAARISTAGTSDQFPEDLASYYSKWSAYPFAAPFGNPITGDYRGANATYQRFVPATTTAGDPTFVVWPASPAPALTNNNGAGNGTVNSQSCSGTGSQTLQCVFNYRRSSGRTPTVTITATANNVGMAFREPLLSTDITITNCSAGGACVLSNRVLSPQTTGSSGNLPVTFSARLPNLGSGNKNATINIPVPDDNSILTHWFFTNQWQRTVYYAVASEVAPSHTPSSSCGTCISVNGTTGNKVVMILMGGALGTQAQPSSSPDDYLENTNRAAAAAGTLVFGLTPRGASYNDLTVVLQ